MKRGRGLRSTSRSWGCGWDQTRSSSSRSVTLNGRTRSGQYEAGQSKTKFVALLVPLFIRVIPGQPVFQLFLQLLHRPYRGNRVLDAKLFATFFTGNDFRIGPLGHLALA